MCVLYLVSEGTKLRKNGGRFLIENDGKRIQSVPINEVESVVVRRCAEISTPALYELFEKNAGVFYVDGRGRLMGQMEVPSGSLLRFEKQRENFFDDEKSVCMIRSTVYCIWLLFVRPVRQKYGRQERQLMKKNAVL